MKEYLDEWKLKMTSKKGNKGKQPVEVGTRQKPGFRQKIPRKLQSAQMIV